MNFNCISNEFFYILLISFSAFIIKSMALITKWKAFSYNLLEYYLARAMFFMEEKKSIFFVFFPVWLIGCASKFWNSQSWCVLRNIVLIRKKIYDKIKITSTLPQDI